MPGDPPVAEAIRRGKAIRVRRRLAAVASVAAVALFAAFGYPALTAQHGAPAPGPVGHKPTPSPGKTLAITDVPPGPQASSNLIAVGTLNGQDWKIAAGVRGANTPPGQQCFAAYGPAFEQGNVALCSPLSAPNALNPVQFSEFFTQDPGPNAIIIGQVRSDIRYVTITLAHGITLKLIPVRQAGGTRYVAFPIPRPVAIDSVSAYLPDGDYRTAIPFIAPDGQAIFGVWLQPGQRGQSRATKLVGYAPPGTKAWALFVAVGPWGICVYNSPNANISCLGTSGPLGTGLQGFMGAPRVHWGTAPLVASYVRLTMTNGETAQVNAVAVGNEKYFAFVLGNGQLLRRWTVYDAAGKQVATGTS